jgi:hypothetical protein
MLHNDHQPCVCDTDSVFIFYQFSFLFRNFILLQFCNVWVNSSKILSFVLFEISISLVFFKNENFFHSLLFLLFSLGQEDEADKEDNDLGGSRCPVPIVAASTVAVNLDKSLISEGEGGG